MDGIPGVGHIKGFYHYASGDVDEGNKAMCAASRTTGVIAGGALGSLAGPAGAYWGGALAGTMIDCTYSVVQGEPVGVFGDLDRMGSDVCEGRLPIYSTIDTAVSVGGDAFTGKVGGELYSSGQWVTRSALAKQGGVLFLNGVKEESSRRRHERERSSRKKRSGRK